MPGDSPSVDEVHTVTIRCRQWYSGYAIRPTLGSLEAFTAALRRHGAPDDTPIENGADLEVTLDLKQPDRNAKEAR